MSAGCENDSYTADQTNLEADAAEKISEERIDEQETVFQDGEISVSESEEDAVVDPEPTVYSYTEMAAVMYASAWVNVRDLPSVDG